MPRYLLTISEDVCDRLLPDVISMNPFPIERRWHHTLRNYWCVSLKLSLTEEELAFLVLRYEMLVPPHEITAVDVIGDLLA